MRDEQGVAVELNTLWEVSCCRLVLSTCRPVLSTVSNFRICQLIGILSMCTTIYMMFSMKISPVGILLVNIFSCVILDNLFFALVFVFVFAEPQSSLQTMKINPVGIPLLFNIFSYVILDNLCTDREDLGAMMAPGVFQLCQTSESESDRNCQNCPEAHSACQVTLCIAKPRKRGHEVKVEICNTALYFFCVFLCVVRVPKRYNK